MVHYVYHLWHRGIMVESHATCVSGHQTTSKNLMTLYTKKCLPLYYEKSHRFGESYWSKTQYDTHAWSALMRVCAVRLLSGNIFL